MASLVIRLQRWLRGFGGPTAEENRRGLAARGESLDRLQIRDARPDEVKALSFADEGNPTCAFYEALGGHNVPNTDGTPNHGNFGWHDLRPLALL